MATDAERQRTGLSGGVKPRSYQVTLALLGRRRAGDPTAAVDVVALSLVSAVCFGAMSVVLRLALAHVPDADVGALVTALAGFAVAAVYALAGGVRIDAEGAAIMAVAGLLSPGSSQLLFTFAIREVGASRTSVVTGAAPLFAVVLALVVLDEPFEIALIVGAGLIVLGGVVLVSERGRPAHLRTLGLILAAAGAIVFAVRDTYVRGVSDDVDIEPAAAAAVALFTGAVAILGYVLVTRRGRLPSPGSGCPSSRPGSSSGSPTCSSSRPSTEGACRWSRRWWRPKPCSPSSLPRSCCIKRS